MGTWILGLSSATSSMRLFTPLPSFEGWDQLHQVWVALSPHHKWDWCQNWEELSRGCNDPRIWGE